MISLFWAAVLTAAAATEVRVEIMRTQPELSRGLQGHRALKEGEGMLFVFPEPEAARFWMKDVTFPIDIIFFDNRTGVANVASDAPPCPAAPCPVYDSEGVVTHVLEVPAGWSKRHGVRRGTRLRIDESRKTVTVHAPSKP